MKSAQGPNVIYCQRNQQGIQYQIHHYVQHKWLNVGQLESPAGRCRRNKAQSCDIGKAPVLFFVFCDKQDRREHKQREQTDIHNVVPRKLIGISNTLGNTDFCCPLRYPITQQYYRPCQRETQQTNFAVARHIAAGGELGLQYIEANSDEECNPVHVMQQVKLLRTRHDRQKISEGEA
jgi:hypothetical protein